MLSAPAYSGKHGYLCGDGCVLHGVPGTVPPTVGSFQPEP